MITKLAHSKLRQQVLMIWFSWLFHLDLLLSKTNSSLLICRFSLHYPDKISCLIMRIKQTIIHSNLSEMKNKILPTSLQGNYRDSLGEFNNTSYGVFVAKRVKQNRLMHDDVLLINFTTTPHSHALFARFFHLPCWYSFQFLSFGKHLHFDCEAWWWN